MKTSEIRDQKVRNNEVRKAITQVVKENGMTYKFVAEHLKISSASFSRWRHNKYDFAHQKLGALEVFIGKYTFEGE